MFPVLDILKRIPMRQFQREMYKYTQKTPIIVTNRGDDFWLVINLKGLFKDIKLGRTTIWDRFIKKK